MPLAATIERIPDEVAPSRAASIMLWTIAAFTAALLLWAGFARVEEVAVASGKVIPSSQLQVVSNLEGGIVKAILVKTGQKVAKGQLLLQLDTTQATSEFGRTDETHTALAARVARLTAEVDGGVPAFPDWLMRSAPTVVATERALWTARRADLDAQVRAETARLDQAQRTEAQARVEAATRGQEAELAQREVAMLAPLVDKGIAPRIELLRAESAAAQAKGERDSAALAIRRAACALAEAQASLHKVREAYRAQAVEQLTTARSELAAQGEALPALQDRLTRTELRSPIDGIVQRVLVTTVGGTVRPGEPLVEVVPQNEELVIEAAVRPADIAFIHEGQKAFVKLTAYDYSVYGGLQGVVERISPDATVNPANGESHFTVRVRTTRNDMVAPDGQKLPIGVGMQAEVDVLGRKRSVLSYLLTPFTKLSDNAFREK